MKSTSEYPSKIPDTGIYGALRSVSSKEARSEIEGFVCFLDFFSQPSTHPM
jgi:hypothetical protein